MKALPIIHAALDQVTRQDLGGSQHQSIYEQYADQLEVLTARVRGLLCHPGHIPASYTNTQHLAILQDNTFTLPLPPSPEKQQYQKESQSIH
jgi:hypothetical protein